MNQDEFVEKAKQQLDSWNAEIKKMRAEAEKMQAKGESQAKIHLAQMEERRKDMQDQIEKANEANKAAWQDMQTGFQDAWNSMEKGMSDARKRYSGD